MGHGSHVFQSGDALEDLDITHGKLAVATMNSIVHVEIDKAPIAWTPFQVTVLFR